MLPTTFVAEIIYFLGVEEVFRLEGQKCLGEKI
jgi:hypothetical protein